jgi:hypothetical protein
LNESLQELTLGFWRGAPNVFEDFMGVEKLFAVEQPNPVEVGGAIQVWG